TVGRGVGTPSQQTGLHQLQIGPRCVEIGSNRPGGRESPMASQSFDRAHRPTTTLAERRLRHASSGRLDLTGHINRYGPPEAVLRALRTLSPRDLQISPAAAASRLADRYAEALGVDPAELVAGRGPSEALRATAARAPHAP